MDVFAGLHVLIADTSLAFAAAVGRLLTEPHLEADLTRAARRLAATVIVRGCWWSTATCWPRRWRDAPVKEGRSMVPWEIIEAARLRLGLLGQGGRTVPAAGSGTLILVFNTMWGHAPDLLRQRLPDGYELTTDKRRYHAAAVVVFHIPTLGWLPRPPKLPGQLWVAWSMECEVNYPHLRDPAFIGAFDLTMTYRRDSDVPALYTSYFRTAADFVRALQAPPKPKLWDRLAVLLISSRIDRSGRLPYATELMRYLDVHSYGRTLRNRTLPHDVGRASKLELIAGYRFTLAFENAIAQDYVTEKFYDPLIAGSVPVYLGAPNVDDFAPGDHCYINTADFAGPRALADHLLRLAVDKAAYEKYLAWKARPLRSAFLTMLAGQEVPPLVRLCQLLQARPKT
jgi:hypothetical protein